MKIKKNEILNDPALTAAYEILEKKVTELEVIANTNPLSSQKIITLLELVNYDAEAIRLNKLWLGYPIYSSPRAIRKPIFTPAILQKKMKQLANLYWNQPFAFCCALGNTKQAKKIWTGGWLPSQRVRLSDGIVQDSYEYLVKLLGYSLSLAEINQRQETSDWLKSLDPRADGFSKAVILNSAALSEDLELLNRTLFSIKEGTTATRYNSFTRLLSSYDRESASNDEYYEGEYWQDQLNDLLIKLAGTEGLGAIKVIIAHTNDDEEEENLFNFLYPVVHGFMLLEACRKGKLDMIKFILEQSKDPKDLYSQVDEEEDFLYYISRYGNIEDIRSILNIIPETERISHISETAERIITDHSFNRELAAVDYLLNQIPKHYQIHSIQKIASSIADTKCIIKCSLVLKYALEPVPENEQILLMKQLVIKTITQAILNNNCNLIDKLLRVEPEEELESLIPKLVVAILAELEKTETSRMNTHPDLLDQLNQMLETAQKSATLTSDSESESSATLTSDSESESEEQETKRSLIPKLLVPMLAELEKIGTSRINPYSALQVQPDQIRVNQLSVDTPGASGENLQRMSFFTQSSDNESESEEQEAKRMKYV